MYVPTRVQPDLIKGLYGRVLSHNCQGRGLVQKTFFNLDSCLFIFFFLFSSLKVVGPQGSRSLVVNLDLGTKM